MTWLAWRQLRAGVVLAALVVATVIVALVVTRSHVAAVFSPTGDGQLTGASAWLKMLGTVLVGVPAAMGAFWGAPIVAGELEAKTHLLAWTQGVTRRHWLSVKLLLGGTVAAALAAGLSLASTWWAAPIDAAGSRIAPATFAQRGVAPIGYALFAIALGALAGAVLRRTLPAMAATVVVFTAVRYGVQTFLRPHLVGSTLAHSDPFGPLPAGAWVLSTHTIDATGRAVSTGDLQSRLVDACGITRATIDPDRALAACAHRLGIHSQDRIVPAGSFWHLQAAELVIFTALAALAAGATFWWLEHRID